MNNIQCTTSVVKQSGRKGIYERYIKRSMDIIISSLGLLMVSPILLIASLLIVITMPGPLFFKQERVGKDKELFNIVKLRTMKVDKEAENTFDFTKDAQRITPVGKALRRLKIDELPQLFNVMVGDMSLVGPRPTVLKQVEKYSEYEMQRISVKPGMTGLAQTNGNTALTWKQRIYYDICYIQLLSFKLDLLILFKTVLIVLFGEGKYMRRGSPAFNTFHDNPIGEESNQH